MSREQAISMEPARKPMREEFPELARFVDDMRAVFGPEIGGALSRQGQRVSVWGVVAKERTGR